MHTIEVFINKLSDYSPTTIAIKRIATRTGTMTVTASTDLFSPDPFPLSRFCWSEDDDSDVDGFGVGFVVLVTVGGVGGVVVLGGLAVVVFSKLLNQGTSYG